jgi:hypothetical protein
LAKAWLQVANAFSVLLPGLIYPKVEATFGLKLANAFGV